MFHLTRDLGDGRYPGGELDGIGVNEVLCLTGHDRDDTGPMAEELPDEPHGLHRGDAAGDADDDTFPGKGGIPKDDLFRGMHGGFFFVVLFKGYPL